MTVVKTTKGNVFGGYTATNIQIGKYGYEKSPESFLFNVKGENPRYNKWKCPQYRYEKYAHYHHPSYGPCFGGSHDFCITSPNGKRGKANAGFTYKAPTGGYPFYPDGRESFTMTDWEVFVVEGECLRVDTNGIAISGKVDGMYRWNGVDRYEVMTFLSQEQWTSVGLKKLINTNLIFCKVIKVSKT